MAAKKDRRFDKLKKKALEGLSQAQIEERIESNRLRVERSCAQGDWRVAMPAAASKASMEAVLGVRQILQGDVKGWRAVERLVYGHALGCVGNPFNVSVSKVTAPLALLLIWGEDALFRRLAEVAAKVAREKGSLWEEATCMHFLTVLHGRLHGYDAKPAFDCGEYQQLLDLLETKDGVKLAVPLLAACERHLDQSGLDQETVFQEFELGFELIPAEIVAVRVARAKLGLDFPKLDHPLMSTLLAEIPSKASYQYKKDAEYKPALDLIRKAVSDFGF